MIKIISGSNNDKILAKINTMPREFKTAIRLGYYKLGKLMKAKSNELILDKNKTGRIYYLSKTIASGSNKGKSRTVRHQASAPGQAPANFTGKLRKSIGYKVQGWEFLQFGASAPYAADLELGTAKMKARPYLKPAFEDNTRNAKAIFIAEIDKQVIK